MTASADVQERSLQIPFYSIRKITSPEDEASGRAVYAGQLPVKAILDIETNDNVREYLLEAEGLKRRQPTQVHRAIRDTLVNNPDMFSVLNGGVVIVARESAIDEKRRSLRLTNASIINGSQTRGVVGDVVNDGHDLDNVHAKFELIITADDDLVAEISIARNFQNDVQTISIVGRRGELKELDERFQRVHPELTLRQSETQRPAPDNAIADTEKLLQVVAALLPRELWWKSGEPVKTYTYDRKATCLRDFDTIYRIAHDPEDRQHEQMQGVYEFYLDMIGEAKNIYDRWNTHEGWGHTGIRSIKRNNRKIVDVPDGILFPIFASLSEFAVKTKSGWRIQVPQQLHDSKLIEAAKRAYMEMAGSNPGTMGKSRACYAHIDQLTSIYKDLLS